MFRVGYDKVKRHMKVTNVSIANEIIYLNINFNNLIMLFEFSVQNLYLHIPLSLCILLQQKMGLTWPKNAFDSLDKVNAVLMAAWIWGVQLFLKFLN